MNGKQVRTHTSEDIENIERKWVGLKDEEIDDLWEMAKIWNPHKHFYILVEAKLKEKNT